MNNELWFLEGEGEGELDEQGIRWMLDNARWDDDLLITPQDYRLK